MRVAIRDHQGKAAPYALALTAAGHEVVPVTEPADVLLIDHDVPAPGYLPVIESQAAAGAKIFLYPHGAYPILSWDGIHPVSDLVHGNFVIGEGHAEVMRRYEYPHPLHVAGWPYGEVLPFQPCADARRILFAPSHPSGDGYMPEVERELNRLVFDELLSLGVELTVRHIGTLEQNGLERVEGVRYSEGRMVNAFEEIDASQAVVSCVGTFPYLAVARGKPTVFYGQDVRPNDDGDLRAEREPRYALHWDRYRDYMRFPFDAADGPIGELISEAAADEGPIREWKRLFIGDPFDPNGFVQVLEREVKGAVSEPNTKVMASSELHAEALQAVEHGDAERGAELLRRAISDSLDLTMLNDLAVVEAQRGRLDDAELLLEACLRIDDARDDARENLAAVATVSAPERAEQVGWRASQTLGGPDPRMPERAFPGMPEGNVMAEHALRYSLALGLVSGKHVLDLGCGTGYGSEMLTWSAASVRGFDLWEPAEHERPQWQGGAKLSYGHDLCANPLPRADAATMFEVIEHLADAPAALRHAFNAVPLLIGSFPNPVYHGSHHNPFHVNDWTLEEFEQEIAAAASVRFSGLQLTHLHQPVGSWLLVPGRDPNASYWVVIAQGA
ncbi:MAG: methyltransferase domain-containing protein [Thermoleophilaceae bacterium]